MRDAVLRDLLQIPDLVITTTHDGRLLTSSALPSCILSQAIDRHVDSWEIWDACVLQCDAAWIIAPETDGILLRFTQMVERHNKVLLGCGSNAVRVCASKHASYHVLKNLSYPTPSTYRWHEWQMLNANQQSGGWVCKPDDGVGAEDTARFETSVQLNTFMQSRQHSHVIQPYVQGKPASISMFCKHGKAWLLSANLQKIEHLACDGADGTQFIYTGSVVNGMVEYWQAFAEIAQQIARDIPDLAGYVGVDLIVNDQAIWVLEINPRLTSSYPALAEAIACNPAQLLVELICQNNFTMPPITQKRVETFL